MRAGVNRLIVRVDNRRDDGDLPPGNGGWWNYGGINQEVYLRSVQTADMSPVVIRPILPCPTCAAQIQEQVTVRNVTGAAQTVTLRGSYGSAALNFGGHTLLPGRHLGGPRAGHDPRPAPVVADRPLPVPRGAHALRRPRPHAARATPTYSGIRSITVSAGRPAPAQRPRAGPARL